MIILSFHWAHDAVATLNQCQWRWFKTSQQRLVPSGFGHIMQAAGGSWRCSSCHWPGADLMLGQRRRRWSNIKSPPGQWVVLAGDAPGMIVKNVNTRLFDYHLSRFGAAFVLCRWLHCHKYCRYTGLTAWRQAASTTTRIQNNRSTVMWFLAFLRLPHTAKLKTPRECLKRNRRGRF